jgi:branched-chain amino acid transport system substrate-binding protein
MNARFRRPFHLRIFSRTGLLAIAAMVVLGSSASAGADVAGSRGRLRAALLIDAEFGVPASTSAQAIHLGARLAVRDIERSGALDDVALTIRTTDNRGVPAIGVDNFLDAAKDPSVVAVMGGKLSPVQIEVAAVAREQGLMLLDPWGAADGIIDNGFKPNWAFRLSMKDEWASAAFIREARGAGATNLGFILPNSTWGRSTQAALTTRARNEGLRIVGERWYNWGAVTLVQRYLDLLANDAQAVILVANEQEGALLVRELAYLPVDKSRPILSHWGVTGGNLEQLAGEALYTIDFRIVQTFSFERPRTARAAALLSAVLAETGKTSARQIESPVGIAQGYDLTWLLAMAIHAAGSTDRAKVRDAMESLGPFEGAVRKYDRPFTGERHEALSESDVFFARYEKGRGLAPLAP